MHFDGSTYDLDLDGARLAGALVRVKALMLDGQFRTLAAISTAVGASEAGCSARLRDLRKTKFGGFDVQRRRVVGTAGLWEYRVAPPQRTGQQELFAVREALSI